ncbi:MAG: hypothetical protein ACXWDN_21260 [Limisphaerales bacterium]
MRHLKKRNGYVFEQALARWEIREEFALRAKEAFKHFTSVMKEALTIIFVTYHSNEAEEIIRQLRIAGLHPAELALTTPFPFEHGKAKFPVGVPIEETEQAESVIGNRPQFVAA